MSKRIFERRQFQQPTKRGNLQSNVLENNVFEKVFRKVFIENILFTANIILFSSIGAALLEHHENVPYIVGMVAILSFFFGVACFAYFLDLTAKKRTRIQKDKEPYRKIYFQENKN